MHNPDKIPVEGRQLVRDAHSKAILNVNRSERAAYMKRRNARARKANEVAGLRREAAGSRSEIEELKAQVAALADAVKKLTGKKPPCKKASQKKTGDSS